MKWKITDLNSSWFKVEYEDGSWAQIPVTPTSTKRNYEIAIEAFAPKPTVTDTDKLPIKVADEGIVGEYDVDPEEGAANYTYAYARESVYPTLGDQFGAMYKARQGDDTEQKAIDTNIALIKAKFPKDLPNMSYTEMQSRIKELFDEPTWDGTYS
mgnify:CR=1 FL=1|tara:strand:+ start:332 stop:796 length:465 start_codon:yes stop_codon:yes gene_type:complete